jgi:type 1 glutamine amidotransferase
MRRLAWLVAVMVIGAPAAAAARPAKVVFVAGARSHGYGEHDHQAGCRLLAEHLESSGLGIKTAVHYPGWPAESNAFDGATAVVIYADGGARHPILPHLTEMAALAKQGVGLGFIHFAVEIEKGEPGDRFLDFMGGYFEASWSVNPFWTPDTMVLGKHPITQGVRPFSVRDEWYFHMRFAPGQPGFVPLITAVPPASTMDRKDGTHTGNPTVRAEVAAGKPQHLMWARQRPDGGRGFGFTGGHVHWNWAQPDQRRLVLNAIAWIAKVNIPKGGLRTTEVTLEDLERNADDPVPATFDRAKIVDLVATLKRKP